SWTRYRPSERSRQSHRANRAACSGACPWPAGAATRGQSGRNVTDVPRQGGRLMALSACRWAVVAIVSLALVPTVAAFGGRPRYAAAYYYPAPVVWAPGIPVVVSQPTPVVLAPSWPVCPPAIAPVPRGP